MAPLVHFLRYRGFSTVLLFVRIDPRIRGQLFLHLARYESFPLTTYKSDGSLFL
jgi:hypothetical protein